jgi:hypothetical protein
MIFDDLRKSISEMSTDELHEQIRLMRQRRRERPVSTAKKPKKTGQVTIPSSMDIDALIAAMEGIIGETTTNQTK